MYLSKLLILILIILFQACGNVGKRNNEKHIYTKSPKKLDVTLYGVGSISGLLGLAAQSTNIVNISGETKEGYGAAYLSYGATLNIEYFYFFTQANYRKGSQSLSKSVDGVLDSKKPTYVNYAKSRERNEYELGMFWGPFAISYLVVPKNTFHMKDARFTNGNYMHGDSLGFKVYFRSKYGNFHFKYEDGKFEDHVPYQEIGLFTDINFLAFDLW